MSASLACSDTRSANTLAAAALAADDSSDRLISKTIDMMLPDARLFI